MWCGQGVHSSPVTLSFRAGICIRESHKSGESQQMASISWLGWTDENIYRWDSSPDQQVTIEAEPGFDDAHPANAGASVWEHTFCRHLVLGSGVNSLLQ
jgi:hypothetical protein